MGFPMLTVEVIERKDDSISLSVSQSKFSADGVDEPKGAESHWLVPISFATADAPTTSRDKVIILFALYFYTGHSFICFISSFICFFFCPLLAEI